MRGHVIGCCGNTVGNKAHSSDQFQVVPGKTWQCRSFMLMGRFLSEIEHTLNLLTKECATQSANSKLWVLLINAVSNGNRTEWSPIRSVII